LEYVYHSLFNENKKMEKCKWHHKRKVHILYTAAANPTSTHSSLGQVQAYEALVEGMISFVFSLKHNLISKTFWKYARYIISNGFFKIFTMTKLIPCLIYQT